MLVGITINQHQVQSQLHIDNVEGGSMEWCCPKSRKSCAYRTETINMACKDSNNELNEDRGEEKHCAHDGFSKPTKRSSSETQLNIQTHKNIIGQSW